VPSRSKYDEGGLTGRFTKVSSRRIRLEVEDVKLVTIHGVSVVILHMSANRARSMAAEI
jgi:hypothetical protein